MTKKTFIIAASLLLAIAVGLLSLVLWPKGSTVETQGGGKRYTLTPEDRIEVDSMLRDFVARTGSFGLLIEEDSEHARAEAVFEFSSLIDSYDFSEFFVSRHKATRNASDLIASDSELYPNTESYDFRLDDDVANYRSYQSTVESLEVPTEGKEQEMNRGELVPSATVTIGLKSEVHERKPRTIVPEEETEASNIFAEGWIIDERTQKLEQQVTLQVVKLDSGWKVFRVTEGVHPEVLSVVNSNAGKSARLMEGASERSYTYEFNEEDHDHEH